MCGWSTRNRVPRSTAKRCRHCHRRSSRSWRAIRAAASTRSRTQPSGSGNCAPTGRSPVPKPSRSHCRASSTALPLRIHMAHVRHATLAAALALALPLQASSAKFFQATTQTDFLKGELENLSVDSRGQLTLGQRTELVYEAASPVLWTMLPRPDGSLLVGSGNDGKVFRIDAQG